MKLSFVDNIKISGEKRAWNRSLQLEINVLNRRTSPYRWTRSPL